LDLFFSAAAIEAKRIWIGLYFSEKSAFLGEAGFSLNNVVETQILEVCRQ
jgi:hypothetical protein